MLTCRKRRGKAAIASEIAVLHASEHMHEISKCAVDLGRIGG